MNTRPPADPRLRRRILLTLAILMLGVVLADQAGLLDTGNWFSGLNPHQRAERIVWLLRLVFLSLLPLAGYMLYIGGRVIRSRAFPPPGMRVFRTGLLEQGERAVIRGWVILVVGLCVCALALYGALLVPREIMQLMG